MSVATCQLNRVAELSPNPDGIPALHEFEGRFYTVGRSGKTKRLSIAQALSALAKIQDAQAQDDTLGMNSDPEPMTLLLRKAAELVTLVEN